MKNYLLISKDLLSLKIKGLIKKCKLSLYLPLIHPSVTLPQTEKMFILLYLKKKICSEFDVVPGGWRNVFKKLTPRIEATHLLLLILVHSWSLNLPFDKVCESQLGVLRPMVNILHQNNELGYAIDVSFVIRFPYRSASSPKAATCRCCCQPRENAPFTHQKLTPEMVRQENLTHLFTVRLQWELITSSHLMALVAMSNTLMSMAMVGFK